MLPPYAQVMTLGILIPVEIDPGEECPGRPAVLVRGTRQAVRDTLQSGCWWHISGCAIRVLAFRQIGDFRPDLPYLSDFEWLVRCLAQGLSVLYLPRSTMRYRQHSTSVSSKSFRQAQDIREKLLVFARCRNMDYLSLFEYRQRVRAALYELSRRALVRAVRLDFFGLRRHAHLLVETSAKYFLTHI